MFLREIPAELAIRVVRDGAFHSLGFVTHDRPALLAFVAESRYLDALRECPQLSCVLTSDALVDDVAAVVPATCGVAVAVDPKRAFYALHTHLATRTAFYGVSQPSRIAATAFVHPRAIVSDTDVELADNVVIGPGAVVLPGVSIGADTVIRAGSVIGSEGFQVMIDAQGATRVPHAGHVRIGARVDIHSNTCVDRAVFGETVIGDDTTIDNLVYIAHDVRIGARCRIVAHAAIAGSVEIGDGAWIGPSAAISSGIRVGANAWVSIGSVVTRDVAPDAKVSGNFAIDHARYLEFLRTIR
jgi:UDP-3-O-[3-hydroxymyristoyl] glucosamine N-acyltransferase